MFRRYMHIERWGNEEVQGIELGTCHVFPKLDGTNASCWVEESKTDSATLLIKAGSRNRTLGLMEADNAKFCETLLNDVQFEGLRKCLLENPDLRFFLEFLVPHTLHTYRKDAWQKGYVFDVYRLVGDTEIVLPYEEYKEICDKYNINYIPCLRIIKNGSYEDFIHCLEINNYLIEDGKGTGEGIVIKNYNYVNKYHRTTWAKIVTSEFKEIHHKVMGCPVQENVMIEQQIVDKFCTEALIEKVYAKILTEKEGWSSKYIPMLLNIVFYDMIKEDGYEIIKFFKNPTINYKSLNCLVIQKIKQVKKEVF